MRSPERADFGRFSRLFSRQSVAQAEADMELWAQALRPEPGDYLLIGREPDFAVEIRPEDIREMTAGAILLVRSDRPAIRLRLEPYADAPRQVLILGFPTVLERDVAFRELCADAALVLTSGGRTAISSISR